MSVNDYAYPYYSPYTSGGSYAVPPTFTVGTSSTSNTVKFALYDDVDTRSKPVNLTVKTTEMTDGTHLAEIYYNGKLAVVLDKSFKTAEKARRAAQREIDARIVGLFGDL